MFFYSMLNWEEGRRGLPHPVIYTIHVIYLSVLIINHNKFLYINCNRQTYIPSERAKRQRDRERAYPTSDSALASTTIINSCTIIRICYNKVTTEYVFVLAAETLLHTC